jgi:long-chain fatty acid transport protein
MQTRSRRLTLLVLVLVLLGGNSTAWATPLPTFYQGRALGMGGSSLADTDDATATAINPANLTGIERWSATATFTPFMVANSAPFAPGGESDGDRMFVPLMFAGAGVRVFDHAVTGFAIYAESGAGAHYSELPELGGMSMDFKLGVIEAALPFSYEISDQFSLGAALRLGFTTMSTDMPFDAGGGPMRVEQSMSGVGLPGVSAGLRYQPIEQLSLALNYRSKLKMKIDGDGTASGAAGAQSLKVESEWSTPHSFGLGAAYSVIPEQLLIATDVRYVLLDDAVDDLEMDIDMEGVPAPIENVIALQWKNSLTWGTGVEYHAARWLPLRAGYNLTTSGTAKDHATALTPAPGLLHSFTVGAGVALDELAFDLGAAYGTGSADVTSTVNGPPGTYSTTYFMFALSGTYRPGAKPEKPAMATR